MDQQQKAVRINVIMVYNERSSIMIFREPGMVKTRYRIDIGGRDHRSDHPGFMCPSKVDDRENYRCIRLIFNVLKLLWKTSHTFKNKVIS